LKHCRGIVRYDVYALNNRQYSLLRRYPSTATHRYLLEHLIDVCEDSAVQVPVVVHGEAVSEAALRHLNDGILDGVELALDLRIVFREIGQRAHDF
jgi:hypothetical protein